MRRRWGVVLVVVMVALLATTLAASAASVNVVQNGSFEDGFVNGVGQGWTGFDNGGRVYIGYDSEKDAKTIYDGKAAQRIVIRTTGLPGSDRDRYAGIYQVVKVVPNERYMFSFYGMVRSTEGTEKQSKHNYRFEIGYDYDGGTNPWAVTEWKEMDRWAEYAMAKPGKFLGYALGVTPTSDKLTIFVRAWKKFPTPGQEAFFTVDAVSLQGADPARAGATAAQPADKGKTLPATGAGSLLPLLGAALGLAAIALTSLRLARRAH
ncbi:MAG: hypothetical protein V1772_00385 [Chloroflexota bacterium]